MINTSLCRLLVILSVTAGSGIAFGSAASDADQLHVWTKGEVEVLRSLWIGSLPPPPRDPSNAYSDDPKAARLGAKIFFDKRFSKNGKVSCGTCHEKNYSFTEDMPRAHGIGSTVRRTPPIIGAAYLSWFFWDGRADSLWAQALGPPENPVEHGVTRTQCAQIVNQYYKDEYEEVFGVLPDFPGDVCPPAAKPDPEDKDAHKAWTSMPPEKADEITRTYVNIGKALAAFERQIVPGPSRFDRYVDALLRGDTDKMSETLDAKEVAGLKLFIQKDRCVQCHSGPLFTNSQFRKTGVYQPAELPPDPGRAEGIAKVLSSEFNCLGKYSDADSSHCGHLKTLDADTDKYIGAFKVPTLRNVAERAPYMHAGQYWALWEVLRFYSRMKPSPDVSPEFHFGRLSDDEATILEAFLRTLSGPLIIPEYEGIPDDDEHHH